MVTINVMQAQSDLKTKDQSSKLMIAPIYGAYAPIYDSIGQGRFAERMAGWALGWLSERGARPTDLLDLACGTGAAALFFAAAGCAAAGVDQSAAMLSIARGRARDAGYDIAFVEGDIRDLNAKCKMQNDGMASGNSAFYILHSAFDLVTCFYDSLNYLTEDGDLERAFVGAAEALRPGGHFFFDVITAAEYEAWGERDVVVYDGRECLVYNRLGYDPATRLASGRIVWFVRETELWWRGEETHAQRAWSDAELRAALTHAGLALCALRCPWRSPSSTASSQLRRAAVSRPDSTCSSISFVASRCLRITRRWGSRFFSNSSYGPIAAATSPEVRYARPVISAVIAAATERPSCESYGRPRAIRSAPRFA
jgi:SAM-dependent methyltransferase